MASKIEDTIVGGSGNAEMDPAQGQGWAVLKGDELHGTIFIHMGDDSEFMAKVAKSTKRKKYP